MFNSIKSLFLILPKCDKSVIKNKKNCFFLQPAIHKIFKLTSTTDLILIINFLI